MSEITLESQLIDIIKDKNMPEHIKMAKVEMLVNLGVDVNTTYNVKSPLFLAKECGEKAVYEFMEAKGAKEFFDKEKAEKISLDFKKCIITGNFNLDKIKELISKGADVNANADGQTLLMKASYKGCKDVVELLISKGADVNAKNIDKNTALMYASLSGAKEVAEFLIDKGALVEAQSVYGTTALINASQYGHREFVEMLISRGADVNRKNIDGVTALMLASLDCHKDTIELLIEKGADINIKNKHGETAMMWASVDHIRKIIMDAVKKRDEKDKGEFVGTMRSCFER